MDALLAAYLAYYTLLHATAPLTGHRSTVRACTDVVHRQYDSGGGMGTGDGLHRSVWLKILAWLPIEKRGR